ncbi:uncharacterized protein BXZ73DRAFT_54095, partial [Epithele typhae]|uniref:uncharacterized protein n=1 Tax=Epithele typhae TaxID=378194 RepID=UPI0020082991
VFFFDYILTIREEISLFWNSKLTLAAALFFANRYLSIITLVYDITLNFVPTPTVKVRLCQVKCLLWPIF